MYKPATEAGLPGEAEAVLHLPYPDTPNGSGDVAIPRPDGGDDLAAMHPMGGTDPSAQYAYEDLLYMTAVELYQERRSQHPSRFSRFVARKKDWREAEEEAAALYGDISELGGIILRPELLRPDSFALRAQVRTQKFFEDMHDLLNKYGPTAVCLRALTAINTMANAMPKRKKFVAGGVATVLATAIAGYVEFKLAHGAVTTAGEVSKELTEGLSTARK